MKSVSDALTPTQSTNTIWNERVPDSSHQQWSVQHATICIESELAFQTPSKGIDLNSKASLGQATTQPAQSNRHRNLHSIRTGQQACIIHFTGSTAVTIEQLACGNNIVLLSPASAQVYTFSSLLSFAQQKSFLSPTSILAAIINQN